VIDVAGLAREIDGELFTPDSPSYDAVRRPHNPAFRNARPRLVVRCRSVSDVVVAVDHARRNGIHVVPRGGGHCFAGRSSTEGIVLDLAELDDITIAANGLATIGAGARLDQVYAALHRKGRTIPAGCGGTVGIAGLTLGGGIGLLGRTHGLTCDHLVGAQVVLAEGPVVECDRDRHPDLFWALRGAGGGQFGVVTSLTFDTMEEPATTRFEGHWSDVALDELVSVWQTWAPDVVDAVTANLSLVAEPGRSVRATLFGASLLGEAATRDLLGDFSAAAGVSRALDLRSGVAFTELKDTFDDLDPRVDPESAIRIRSEFFAHPMRRSTVAAVVARFEDRTNSAPRQLTFTPMGGAYNRSAESATAFAHRDERFLLEHIGAPTDTWIDSSWAIAHADGSGHVYPNFPDPALDDWTTAYHAGNHSRLAEVKNAYDPGHLFHFPQSL
jgi:FAD/FMN-containing dehydrogenase